MARAEFKIRGRVGALALAVALSAPATVHGGDGDGVPPADPLRLASTTVPSVGRATGKAQWGPIQIVVYKSRHVLAVYRFGNFYREYPVVFGANPVGRKRFMYDARTPEGSYHITDKRVHERWQYFLALDYPNNKDRQIYGDELRRGLIPRDDDGAPFDIGGDIGIHGNDKPDKQARGINWTQGCIAMRGPDIAEVYTLVTVGTPVWVVQ